MDKKPLICFALIVAFSLSVAFIFQSFQESPSSDDDVKAGVIGNKIVTEDGDVIAILENRAHSVGEEPPGQPISEEDVDG